MKPILAQRIRAARQAIHPPLTQRDVAKQLHLSPSAINLWEAGRTEPSAASLIEMSRMFSVSVDWLLGLEQARPTRARVAPLVNLVPVVTPSEMIRWHWDAVSEMLQTSAMYPPSTAAALRVMSEAMSSSCPTGSYVVVSKASLCASGSIVLAHFGKSSEPVLRKLVHEGRDDLLVADDTRFPTYALRDGATIIGRAVEVVVRHSLI